MKVMKKSAKFSHIYFSSLDGLPDVGVEKPAKRIEGLESLKSRRFAFQFVGRKAILTPKKFSSRHGEF